MAMISCLFRTSNRDSARLFKEALRAFEMDISSEHKEDNDFYCELITVTDNSYNASRYANVRAYATAYQMELLKVNGKPVKSD